MRFNKKAQTYFIKTFGCQMNKADSERISAKFKKLGYQQARSIKTADKVIINTCSVRQSAENRVMGLVHNLKHKIKAKQKIIITGCMLHYSLAKLKKMIPGADEFIKLKDLVAEYGEADRESKTNAWVSIMVGCDNFCTYCIVPYSRGREISRPIEDIYNEVKELVKKGYQQITLLGQNVNSYGKNLKIENIKAKESLKSQIKKLKKKYKNNFAVLLALLQQIKGIQKIKFLTSNPQDLTDDIIKAMKLPKIDRYLHLAFQSGDDKILKKMNRRYTAKQFLTLINQIKKEIPDIEIGTDIIVGFPGETKKQFQNTVSLCKKAHFSIAYINKYSPRPGTPAYKLKDNVSPAEKKRRWHILDKIINQKHHRYCRKS